MFYAVMLTTEAEAEQVSRICESLRVARKWAKWLAAQRFAVKVRIMAGGPGGDEVA